MVYHIKHVNACGPDFQVALSASSLWNQNNLPYKYGNEIKNNLKAVKLAKKNQNK